MEGELLAAKEQFLQTAKQYQQRIDEMGRILEALAETLESDG